ncbi:hypothetical protein [Cohaesibacter celericrescens]|uniref:Uncharacterized protein n=1 Tax=Cohaesibacter celericrescens TaxID=2067669 RepID=A0A2N5XSB5_9HYPH|nr:hypothetical protein [Cohaesibacter celericrescens]PLW77345.1 hypothetical protein C0081_08355 [Cohaesibacter celericrescens]
MIGPLFSIIAGQASTKVKQKVKRTYQDSLFIAFAGLAFLTCYLFGMVAVFVALMEEYGAAPAALALSAASLMLGAAMLLGLKIIRHQRKKRDQQVQTNGSDIVATGALIGAFSKSPTMMMVAGAGLLGAAFLLRKSTSDDQ